MNEENSSKQQLHHVIEGAMTSDRIDGYEINLDLALMSCSLQLTDLVFLPQLLGSKAQGGRLETSWHGTEIKTNGSLKN